MQVCCKSFSRAGAAPPLLYTSLASFTVKGNLNSYFFPQIGKQRKHGVIFKNNTKYIQKRCSRSYTSCHLNVRKYKKTGAQYIMEESTWRTSRITYQIWMGSSSKAQRSFQEQQNSCKICWLAAFRS